MDIDRINNAITTLLDFKARAEPMLQEWMEFKRKDAGGLPPGQGEPINQELHDAIHAKLPDGDLQYKTDDPAPEDAKDDGTGAQGDAGGDPNATPPSGDPATGAAPPAA